MKKYIPAGDSNIWQSYGLDPNTVKTISDKELANIPTDDGVPKVDYYNSETHKQGIWKALAQVVLPFIPVIGQLYTIYQGIRGIKEGNYLQGALGFLGGLGQLAKLNPAQFAKFGSLGKLAANLNNLNNIDTISKLTSLANTINTINKASIALFANDLTDGSGRKIQGVNRFLAGLQTTKFGLGKIAGNFNLNDGQLEFLAKTGDNIDKITDYYQKGVMITGKEKIFSGKEVSDEERISLAGNLLGAHIQKAASNPNTNIAEAMGKGLANFVTDMVVSTPINVIGDAAKISANILQSTVNQAIKAYSANIKTEYFPLTAFTDAVEVYKRSTAVLGNSESAVNVFYKWILNMWDKITNFNIETTGQNITNLKDISDSALRKEIERYMELDKDNKLGVKGYEAEKYLEEYWRRHRDDLNNNLDDVAKVGKELAIDIGNEVLKNLDVTKNFWKTAKIINHLLNGDINKAILELDPTGIVSIVKKIEKYPVVYGGELFKGLGIQFGNELRIYKDEIRKYTVAQMANYPDPDSYFNNNLPGNNLIKADIIYYMRYQTHIPGIELPNDIKDWIKEAIVK
ncbi:MAG: hypothetical protein AB1414_07475 [bacterium]